MMAPIANGLGPGEDLCIDSAESTAGTDLFGGDADILIVIVDRGDERADVRADTWCRDYPGEPIELAGAVDACSVRAAGRPDGLTETAAVARIGDTVVSSTSVPSSSTPPPLGAVEDAVAVALTRL